MADEAEVAYRTNEIWSALSAARVTLNDVAEGTGTRTFGETMGDRMEEIQKLVPRIEAVRRLERIALATTDSSAQVGADENLRREFAGVQNAVAPLIAKFSEAQQTLEDLGKDLPERSQELQAGITHLEAIEQLPGRMTGETEQLRSQLVTAQSAVEKARTVLEQVETRLESARATAGRFTVVALAVTEEGPHANAAEEIRVALANEVASTRGDAEALADAITPQDQQGNAGSAQDAALADGLRAAAVGLPPGRTSGEYVPAVSVAQTYNYREGNRANTNER